MKIAIHNRPGSFSDRWIEYCNEKEIAYKLVNCYDSDIISQLNDCNALMWHYHHTNYKDVLFARQLLFSLQQDSKKVFPDFNTGWHFDDKVGQKYLLESINAPLVPSYVFYTKKEALEWVNSTTFPKVFKLRGGAGSSNVQLIKTNFQAKKIIKKAFGNGFSQYNKWGSLKERVRKVKSGKGNYIDILKGIGRFFISQEFARMHGKEKGYVYFQDFIENEGYDIRVVVINNKAVAVKRLIRENDFRASGSGNLVFENENIDKRFIKLAFELAKTLNTQSSAFDFIQDLNSNIYVVEMSYGFPMLNFLDGAGGYWTDDIIWHEGNFNLQGWMVETLF